MQKVMLNYFKRTGICINNPSGTDWVLLDSPSNDTIIKQIGLGSDSVWAMDNYGKVYYRIGITPNLLQGKKWVNVRSNSTNISVSSSNSLWAINWDDLRLYYRAGIDLESGEVGGTEWKKVLLKCKKYLYSSVASEVDHLSVEVAQDKMTKSYDSLNLNMALNDNQKEQEIVKDKPKEPITYYIDEDMSIYDSDYKTDSYKETTSTSTSNNEPNMNNSISNDTKIDKRISGININLYSKANTIENIKTELAETDESLDNFILKYQLKDIESANHDQDTISQLNKMESNSQSLIKKRSWTQLSNYSNDETGSASISNFPNSETSSLKSFESNTMLLDVDFKYCNANSFHIDSLQFNWYVFRILF